MSTTVVLLDSEMGRKIVQKHIKKEKIPAGLLEELVGAELEQEGKLRKRGLSERFDEILDTYIE